MALSNVFPVIKAPAVPSIAEQGEKGKIKGAENFSFFHIFSRASVFAFSPLKRSHNHTVLKKRATATAKKAQKEGKKHRFRYSYSP
jgi:hypothetical protein